MIKVNGIRLGNYVNYMDYIVEIGEIRGDKKIRTISEKKRKLSGLFSIENLKPIPLTEEWLLRFGYKETEEDLFENETCLSIWRDPKTFNGFLADWADKTICEVKHVHNLQNLHFSFANEELQCQL